MSLICIEFEPEFSNPNNQEYKMKKDLKVLFSKLGETKVHRWENGFTCIYWFEELISTPEEIVLVCDHTQYSFICIPVFIEGRMILTKEEQIVIGNIYSYSKNKIKKIDNRSISTLSIR